MFFLFEQFKNIIINIFFLFLNLFIKKDDNLYLCGSWFGNRFADNSSYFFLYINNYCKGKKAIWITKNKEILAMLIENHYEAYMAWSLKGIYYALKAKYHLVDQGYDDINPYTSVNSIKLNLWHGFALKKVGKLRFNKPPKRKKSFPLRKFINKFTSQGFWRESYFLITSQLSKEIYIKAYPRSEDKMLLANYPRNELLIKDLFDHLILDKNILSLLTRIDNAKNKGMKIIGYFPTFRDAGDDLFLGISELEGILDFDKFLEENKIIMVTKFHFGIQLTSSSLKNFILQLEKLNSIIIINEQNDIYPILKKTDVLITDYSSISCDFIWLNRPIIYYPYDLQNYIEKDRGLIFDYDEITPGIKVFNIKELKKEILNAIAGNDEYQNEREKLMKKVFELKEGSEEIINQLSRI